MTICFEYDGANRLVKTIDPLQQATQYEYNALSEMTAVVDALGQRCVFVYDKVGRLKRTRRGGQSMTFTYDAVGNRKQRTDYNGATTVYTYNALNRLTDVTYPDSSTVAYSYDKLGRLKTATNDQGTMSFGYNRVNRLISATDVFSQVVDYSYDLNGNRTKATLNAATIATYRYDVVDRLTKLIDEAGAATTYTYDAAGRPISRRLPNGMVTTQEYDGLDRLARLKHAKGANVIADNQYQYNAASQISQIAEPATTRSFAYDPTDRLTAMTSPTLPAESYAYDSVGNRTSSHLSATYTHQPVNKLTQTSTASYSYDNNGNLISKNDGTGTWTYAWDYENRLKQVTRPDGVTVSYKYDALGRRIQRTPSNGVSSNFTYDGQDVVLDQNSDGSTVRYLNGPGIDNKLRQTTSTSTSLYFLSDHLGSTRALTNANGAVVESINYDSFGNGAGSALTRYTYTGRERDPDTAQLYYRARYYDPQVGRFISEDPIGLEGGINWYAYVRNNPVNFNDPEGLQVRSDRDRPGDYYPGMKEPYKPGRPDWGEFRCIVSRAFEGYNPWITVEGGAGIHVFSLPGLNVSGGMMVNLFTFEICFYVKACARPGFGVLIGASVKGGVALGASQSKATGNFSGELTGEMMIPSNAGSFRGEGRSGSIGPNGGSVGFGPSLGGGFSVGVDACYIKVSCINSPKCNCN